MPRPVRPPCRRALGALLLCALALAPACAPDPGPVDLRLTLVPEGKPKRRPRNTTFILEVEPARWTSDAPGMEALPGEPGLPARVMFGAGKEDQALTITRRGPLDLEAVRAVRVTATFEGTGEMVVGFLRDGEMVCRMGPVPLTDSERARAYDVPVPEDQRDLQGVDGLRIACWGRKRRLGLIEVELVSDYDLSALKHPEGFVLAGDTWRHGWAVVSGAPMVTRLTPGRETVLDFGLALPNKLARPPGVPPDRLHLSARDEDGDVLDETWFEVDGGPVPQRRWLDATWDLSHLAGDELTLRFAMEPAPDGSTTAAYVAGPRAGRRVEGAPLVLLVTSDTHRADHLGVAGASWLDTPALDALAKRGTVFLDCWSPTNVTGPAHQALLTGEHPRDMPPIKNAVVMDERVPTLAELFAADGWRTLAVVSAKHLGHKYSGLGRGFDRLSRPEASQREGAESVAILHDWLDQEWGRPVFAWLHLFDAHTPYEPPPAFDRRYYDADKDPFADDHGHPGPIPPEDMPGLKDMSYARAQYAGEVSGLDALLADLFARPRVAGGLVAFVSDHGEGLGEHHVFFGHAQLYPETLAVPLILAGPGVPVGAVEERPVTSLDLGRTLLDLTGRRAAPFPGRSLLEGGTSGPRFLVSSGGRSAGVVDGRWLLTLALREHHGPHTVRGYATHELALYDRVADPGCHQELSAVEPGRASAMRAALVAWLTRAQGGGEGLALEDAETGAMLAELGYAGMTELEASSLWVPDDCEHCLRWEGEG